VCVYWLDTSWIHPSYHRFCKIVCDLAHVETSYEYNLVTLGNVDLLYSLLADNLIEYRDVSFAACR
jgi:hypothetical protein